MRQHHPRVERFFLKLILGIFGGIVLIIALSWGGHFYYVKWQQHRLMQQAHAAMDQGNIRFALMAAGRAAGYNPYNLDACRTLADLLEKSGDATALEWRRRVVEVDNSLPNTLALVATALKFKQPVIAAQALEKLSSADKNTAGYHSAAARIAVAQGNSAAAEPHLNKAVELAPEDPNRLLDLVIFQLNSPRSELREKGRLTAERLKENPEVRAQILRILIDSAVKERNSAVTLDLARELQALPDATFSDRLLYLSALQATADPGAEEYLTKLQTDAKDNADKVFRLLAWMNANDLTAKSLTWKESLSPEILGDAHVRLALADAYLARQDWPQLQQLVEKNTWGGYEFLRFALKARLARARNDQPEFTKDWTEAVRLAGEKIPALKLLEQVSASWGWKEEATNVLWIRAETREGGAEALETLSRQYDQERDTRGLYRVLAHLVKLSPDDAMARNNFAQLALLLNVDVQNARITARDLYNQNPKNPIFASTYAFALEQAGDPKQALKVMSGLTPEQLRVPNMAAYYGIILAAANKPQEAAEYLQLAEQARLLPEEEALVNRSRTAIAPH